MSILKNITYGFLAFCVCASLLGGCSGCARKEKAKKDRRADKDRRVMDDEKVKALIARLKTEDPIERARAAEERGLEALGQLIEAL